MSEKPIFSHTDNGGYRANFWSTQGGVVVVSSGPYPGGIVAVEIPHAAIPALIEALAKEQPEPEPGDPLLHTITPRGAQLRASFGGVEKWVARCSVCEKPVILEMISRHNPGGMWVHESEALTNTPTQPEPEPAGRLCNWCDLPYGHAGPCGPEAGREAGNVR